MKRWISIALVLLFLLAGCGVQGVHDNSTSSQKGVTVEGNSANLQPSGNPSAARKEGGILQVHFLDVGQADSILILSPTGKAALIDGGNREDGPRVVNYLKEQGVTALSLLVSTHPHEDHIGGLKEVVENFLVKEIIDSGVPHTSRTYEQYLSAVDARGIPFKIAEPGQTFSLGNGVQMQILGPIDRQGKDLNNSSVVLRLTYGQDAFLFTGDAGEAEESDLLQKYWSQGLLRAQVLKVGHHGSSSSTSQEFLHAVSPKIAVISVGKDNDYGHPHKETLQRLKDAGVTIYRTDLEGTIKIGCDGKNYFMLPR